MNRSAGTAQALITYDERSLYRPGWHVKIDLQIIDDSIGSATVCSTHLHSKMVLSTPDQKLGFRVLETGEDGKMSGHYISSDPVDRGVWSVGPVSSLGKEKEER